MKKRFLEDIVQEDVDSKVVINRGLGTKVRDFLDHPLVKQPIAVSTGAFFIANYLGLDPEFNLAASYGLYTTLGLVNEYVLETSKSTSRDIYSWILNNPKIVALIGTISAGFAIHYGESNMRDVVNGGVKYLTIGQAVQAGIATEAIDRGLKNLKRIKKSIKSLKTNFKESVYNAIWEHPLAASGLSFLFWFNNVYNYRTQYRVEHPVAGFLSGNVLEDLIHNPGTMISVASRTGLDTAITIGTYLVAGSILHGHSLREYYYRTAKVFNSTIGKKEKVIEYQNKLVTLPNSVERTIENLVDLGNTYYENGNRNEAFRNYRRALRLFSKKSDRISYSDFFRKSFRLDKINRFVSKLRNKKHDEESLINRVFIELLNKDIDAADKMKLAVEKIPDDPSLVYMYGKVLDILGYKESARVQKFKAINLAMRENSGLEVRLGSKCPIIKFNSEVLQEEAIAKYAAIEDLIGEIKTTEKVREITNETESFDVPVPIGIKEINGRQYYIMELVSGDLLSDRIKDEKATSEDFCAVAEFMGLIHACLELELKERNHLERINNKLIESGVDKNETKGICNNLNPVLNNLECMPLVYHKDAHPQNWIIDEFGYIVAIDFEASDKVRLPIDAAKLLNRNRILNYGEKISILEHYIKNFKTYSKIDVISSENNIILAYLNATIITAFESYKRALNQPEIRLAVMENAKISIDKISEVFPDYYKSNEMAYKYLYNALEKLK